MSSLKTYLRPNPVYLAVMASFPLQSMTPTAWPQPQVISSDTAQTSIWPTSVLPRQRPSDLPKVQIQRTSHQVWAAAMARAANYWVGLFDHRNLRNLENLLPEADNLLQRYRAANLQIGVDLGKADQTAYWVALNGSPVTLFHLPRWQEG